AAVRAPRPHPPPAGISHRRDELKPALEQLDAAAKVNPVSVGTLSAKLLRANVLDEMGRRDEAVAAYREVLDVDRDNETVLQALIRLSLAAGKQSEALGYLRHYSLAVGDNVPGLLRPAEPSLPLRR